MSMLRPPTTPILMVIVGSLRDGVTQQGTDSERDDCGDEAEERLTRTRPPHVAAGHERDRSTESEEANGAAGHAEHDRRCSRKEHEGKDGDDCTDREEEERCDRGCLLYTSPSPRDGLLSRMPSSA